MSSSSPVHAVSSSQPGITSGIRHRFVSLAALATFALLLAGWAGSASAAPPVWQARPTPSVLGGGFRGVSCVGSGSCVAVGGISINSHQKSLAETEKDGHWKVDSLPQPAGDSNLYSVSCTALTSCVAVGSTAAPSHNRVITEVLSGTTWKLVAPALLAGVSDSQLVSVSCATKTACVAVGSWDDSSGHSGTLVESYNGHKWSLIKTVAFAGDAELNGVSCVTATTPLLCTAVGDISGGVDTKPLVEHANGSHWSIVSVPSVAGSNAVSLQSVSCPEPTSCVSVGMALKGNGFRGISEIENLLHWTVEATPASPVPHGSVSLVGVSCPLSINACRAVGESGRAGEQTLAETWNGSVWRVQTSADPSGLSELQGVSCVTVRTDGVGCTAAGEYQGNPQGPSHTLAERN
jgi:hypothetical protein